MSIVCLMNGATSVRERGSEGFTVLDCGCAHSDVRWAQFCRAHGAPYQFLHMQALMEHAREVAIKELTS